MRIAARHAPVIFGGLLSAIMVAVISLAMVLTTRGIGPGIWSAWLRGFCLAWPVAFPTVLIVAPFVRRVVNCLVFE